MKTCKHIVTWNCNRRCPYCINKYLERTGGRVFTTGAAYGRMLMDGTKHLIITGGEPTTLGVEKLSRTINVAREYFSKISLYTQNHDVAATKYWTSLDIDDVVLGIHNTSDIPTVHNNFKIYASLLYEPGNDWAKVAQILLGLGYVGMSINLKYPNKGFEGRVETLIPKYANFKVRFKDDCGVQEGRILGPDLSWYRMRRV